MALSVGTRLGRTKFDVDRLRITDAAVAVLEVVPGLHLTGQFALGKTGRSYMFRMARGRHATSSASIGNNARNHFQPSRRFTTAQNFPPTQIPRNDRRTKPKK